MRRKKRLSHYGTAGKGATERGGASMAADRSKMPF